MHGALQMVPEHFRIFFVALLSACYKKKLTDQQIEQEIASRVFSNRSNKTQKGFPLLEEALAQANISENSTGQVAAGPEEKEDGWDLIPVINSYSVGQVEIPVEAPNSPIQFASHCSDVVIMTVDE